MSPRFIQFMPFIFEWEGEAYEHDPDDPGGATKFGIDQRSHPLENIRELTKERATEIYWREWVDDGCEAIPSPLAEIFFDACVNCGRTQALKFRFDPVPVKGPEAFLDRREEFYGRLSMQHPKMKKFLRGWINRCTALRRRFDVFDV